MNGSVYLCTLSAAVLICGNAIGKPCEDFNALEDGPLAGQSDWWSDRPEMSTNAFRVMDYLGITQAPADKALVISKADQYVKVVRKDAVRWIPGSTFTFEMDFQVGLSHDHVESAQNGFAIMLGDKKLKQGTRWVVSLGITPEGKWVVRGNAPNWENLKALPPDTFVERPAAGESAISDWFHLRISSTKTTTQNVFKTELQITDMSGRVVLQHAFSEDPVTDAMAELWEQETVSAGLSAKDDINGLVCVDNVTLTSDSGPKIAKKLGDLL